jgi:hypothetical protein
VVRGKLGFGLGRMFGMLSETRARAGEVRVFENDLAGAVAWIAGEADQPPAK